MELSSWTIVVASYGLGWFSAEASRWIFERRHRGEIERLHAMYARMLDRQANLAQYGRAELPPAETTNEPLPEERATRELNDRAIERGIATLREAYASIGLGPDQISDDDIRREVVAVLNGVDAQGVMPQALRQLVPTD